jgi:PAS domain S-box-containing protein
MSLETLDGVRARNSESIWLKLSAHLQAEELFRNLVAESPVGIYIVQDGKFVYVNQSLQNSAGYTGEEFIGMNSLDLVVPEDRETVRKNATAMLKRETATAYEFRITHKSGEIRWASETVASIRFCGRRASIGNFVDITALKKIEEQLTGQGKAESIGQLVLGIAHKINNPLTSIIGFSDLILQQEIPEDLRTDVKIINDEAQNISRILKSLIILIRGDQRNNPIIGINNNS